MDTSTADLLNSPASSSSSSSDQSTTARTAPAKRPAGRTKFRETRHPVYRGVRRRGSASRWVCEVRVPGKRGARLWLGTYATAEAAARANDAAMLALGGRSATACLNFADSAWLLAVPTALSDLADVRRAAVEAVEDFERRRQTANGTPAPAVSLEDEEGTSSAPAQSFSGFDDAGPSEPTVDGQFTAPAAAANDMFRLDLFPEMDTCTYYMSLAEALLMDPPPATATGAYWDNADCGDAGADFTLWSY